MLFAVLKEPMFVLLLSAAGLPLLLGDIGGGLMLLGFVVVIIGITVVVRWRSRCGA